MGAKNLLISAFVILYIPIALIKFGMSLIGIAGLGGMGWVYVWFNLENKVESFNQKIIPAKYLKVFWWPILALSIGIVMAINAQIYAEDDYYGPGSTIYDFFLATLVAIPIGFLMSKWDDSNKANVATKDKKTSVRYKYALTALMLLCGILINTPSLLFIMIALTSDSFSEAIDGSVVILGILTLSGAIVITLIFINSLYKCLQGDIKKALVIYAVFMGASAFFLFFAFLFNLFSGNSIGITV